MKEKCLNKKILPPEIEEKETYMVFFNEENYYEGGYWKITGKKEIKKNEIYELTIIPTRPNSFIETGRGYGEPNWLDETITIKFEKNLHDGSWWMLSSETSYYGLVKGAKKDYSNLEIEKMSGDYDRKFIRNKFKMIESSIRTEDLKSFLKAICSFQYECERTGNLTEDLNIVFIGRRGGLNIDRFYRGGYWSYDPKKKYFPCVNRYLYHTPVRENSRTGDLVNIVDGLLFKVESAEKGILYPPFFKFVKWKNEKLRKNFLKFLEKYEEFLVKIPGQDYMITLVANGSPFRYASRQDDAYWIGIVSSRSPIKYLENILEGK